MAWQSSTTTFANQTTPLPQKKQTSVWPPLKLRRRLGDSVARGMNVASADLLICDMDTDVFKQRVPREHIAQLVHHCISCNMRWVFYVHASKSQILYVVLTRCNRALFSLVDSYNTEKISPVLSWAHAETPSSQLLTGIQETDRVISARLPFWRMVSRDITEGGPFVPVHIFKHGSQTLYNKTKVLDGNAQMRAILRCSTDTLKWEQKVVIQILKSITVNAWVAWRQFQREDLLASWEKFKGLEQYRHALNRVES